MKKEKLKFYNINQSPLYKLSSKKKFYELFISKNLSNSIIIKQKVSDIFANLDQYLCKFKKDRRDMYKLMKELKYINKKLFSLLSKIETPDYLFSKKGKSHIDNAKYHLGNEYVFNIDISSYFPSVKKYKVFNYYRKCLKMPPDIADLMCKFTVFDDHLSQGLSTSPILAYLVNQKMFDSLFNFIKESMFMSVYVDDVTFSSNNPISKSKRDKIIKIVEDSGYEVQSKKIKYFIKGKHKIITGIVISKYSKIQVPNKIKKKIINNEPPKQNPKDGKLKNINSCQLGRIYFARMIEPKSFKRKLAEIKNLKPL